MTLHIPFDNSYTALPDRFFARLDPTPVKKPALVSVNKDLSALLGIDPAALASAEGLAVLAGNRVPDGAEPIAQAYAGHQFGGWVPQLGDGRAILLGEVTGRDGIRRDIQLKGSGPTPFSRMGDGRAWLGPVMREYLVSEAMHALGIPTTRALAAVASGDVVVRERPLPGAVLTRVAQSHIRVGTFQYFAARQDTEGLQALMEHVIDRHYPAANGPLDLLAAVIERQAMLVAQWMGVGFIHGVMNTDNTQIAGETIDYGPCAFMDAYHPQMVFSSIDSGGRYAYGNQPDALVWNIAQFATALLPLMGGERDTAIEKATAAVHRFPDLFRAAWLHVFAAKIGISAPRASDPGLINELLDVMAAGQADFTNTFRALGTPAARDQFADRDAFDAWETTWRNRMDAEPTSETQQAALRASVNPALIPRNHRIEEAIEAGIAGNYAPFERLSAVLARPFEDQGEAADLARPPEPDQIVRQTFCGT